MKGIKLKHKLYYRLFLGDVGVLGVWQSLCVCCPHVKVTSEHSDDTLE